MSVHKRPGSPFWYIQFQYNGKTYLKSSKTTDKRLALKQETQWRDQLVEQVQLGTKPPITITDAFHQYARSKRNLISTRNVDLFSQRAADHWANKQHLHEVQTRDIEHYRLTLAEAGYSSQTIKHALNHVSGTIKFAKRMGHLVAEVEMPSVRIPKGRLRYLTDDEEQRLLNAISPRRQCKGLAAYEDRADKLRQEMDDLYELVILLLDTGARHGEVSKLRWESINFDDRTIKLWRPKVQNQSVLYMSHRVYEILQRRAANKSSSGWVFTDSKGGARQYRAGTFRRAFDRANLPGCSIHTLRHTHATRLIQNGLHLYEVKEILGHADIKTTMRYAHLEQVKVSKKAIDVINALAPNQGPDQTIHSIQKSQ